MSNIWEHPDIIAAEALRHMEDALVIGPLCAKDATSEFSTKSNGWKVGDEVSFRTHGEYAVTDFTGTIQPQDISTSKRSLKIEKHFDISVQVTAREAALDLDSFSDQVLRPSVYEMAEEVDRYLGTKLLEASGLYVSNDLFASPGDVAQARKAATLQQLSMNRNCLLDLDTEAILLGQTWFNQAQTRGADGTSTLRSGEMGRTMGMDFWSSIAFPTNATAHDAGNGAATTNNTDDKNKIGATVLTFDAGTGAVVVGDRLKVAGVRRPLKVKTAVADLSVATEIELIDPITEIIPDNAAVTVVGSGQDFVYHGAIFDEKSLAVAFPMLDQPDDKVSYVIASNGVSLRIVKGYDIVHKVTTMSIDMLVGAFMLDPRRVTLLAEY